MRNVCEWRKPCAESGMDRISSEARQRLMDRQRFLETLTARELAEVEAALLRIEAGAYGRCENCGGPIGAQRLRAIPEARNCIGCASKR